MSILQPTRVRTIESPFGPFVIITCRCGFEIAPVDVDAEEVECPRCL